MSNNPPIMPELTEEEAQFLIEDCESAMAQGLSFIQLDDVSEEAIKKMVRILDFKKSILTATRKAMKG